MYTKYHTVQYFDVIIFSNSSLYCLLLIVLSVDIKMEDIAGVVKLGMPCKFMILE